MQTLENIKKTSEAAVDVYRSGLNMKDSDVVLAASKEVEQLNN